jgi:hypothetical protein
LFITGVVAMMSTLAWRAPTPIVVVNALSPSPVGVFASDPALFSPAEAAAVAAVLTRELQRIDLARDGDVAVGES